MAGARSAAQGSFAYRVCASWKPRTVPGTPDERQPSRLSRVSAPVLSRYIVGVAAAGARSRKSMKDVRPFASRISMKPPPPSAPA
jgi:hypothetical protein